MTCENCNQNEKVIKNLIFEFNCFKERFEKIIKKIGGNITYSKKADVDSINGRYLKAEDDVKEEDERLDIIGEILEYAKENPNFKSQLVESINERLMKDGYISAQQYNSLIRTYNAFRIDKRFVIPKVENP